MQPDLPSSAALLAQVRERFPFLTDEVTSPIRGGRRAALAALARVDPVRYARTRNDLSGAVTQLSPYLRHGVLTLAEVRDHALQQVRRAEEAEKFISELAWREYWQRLYAVLGDGIWDNLEPIKTGFAAASYADELPPELPAGETGLRCMDSFARQLAETGYLHNHARMWVNAYVVHWLRVRWQAGARWFLTHLLDGDPASNNLSWQWGASTFSHKPYIFNRENLERYTDGLYCRECPLRNGGCPFEASYEELEQRLFPRLHSAPVDGETAPRARATARKQDGVRARGERPLLWVHTDALNPAGELFRQHPGTAAVFVWDEGWLREERVSAKRVVFLTECLEEVGEHSGGMTQRQGDVATELLSAAREAGADHVVAMRTPDPRLLKAAAAVERELPVVWLDPPAFVADERAFDLKRFSRFWYKAKFAAMQPTRGR